MLVDEDRADHVDLNFGCPVPKVTRKGGGSALPWKRDLFAAIVAQAVRQADAGRVPVTVKMRKGIDDDHLTYLEAGRIAEAEGVAAVALHARTAADFYSGTADWPAIARLKEAVTGVPVLGNGDIWSAADAVRMVAETGCDGVVVGRGCLGRPWLFADLAAAFAGRDERVRPGLGVVLATLRRHLVLLVEHYAASLRGTPSRGPAATSASTSPGTSRAMPWATRRGRTSALVGALAEFDALVEGLDGDQPYPGEPAEGPRGRSGSARGVALPDGWLDSRELDVADIAELRAAELSVSGG